MFLCIIYCKTGLLNLIIKKSIFIINWIGKTHSVWFLNWVIVSYPVSKSLLLKFVFNSLNLFAVYIMFFRIFFWNVYMKMTKIFPVLKIACYITLRYDNMVWWCTELPLSPPIREFQFCELFEPNSPGKLSYLESL